MMRLELQNLIGMRVSVDVDDVMGAYREMRKFGANGWTSTGEIPEGGYVLPYAMADVFDWSLIGARKFTMKTDDGTEIEAVEHRGLVYKKREFAASRKMPMAIAYTRGARGSERDETKEQKDDYVWLIGFKGNGRVIDALCVPKNGAAKEPTRQENAQNARAAEPAKVPAAPERLARLKTLAGARGIDIDSDQFLEVVRGAIGLARPLTFVALSDIHTDAVIAAIERIPMPSVHEEKPKPTGLVAAVDAMPERMLAGIRTAIERAGLDVDTVADLVAEISELHDGVVTYDIAALSFTAGNALLKRVQQQKQAAHA